MRLRTVVVKYRDGREEKLEGVEDVSLGAAGVFVIDQGESRVYVMGEAVARVTVVEGGQDEPE